MRNLGPTRSRLQVAEPGQEFRARISEFHIFGPVRLRMDSGPELTSVKLAEWAETHEVKLDFIQPGKPTQNSFVERFNRTYREELLDMYVFSRLSEVRDLTEEWLKEYNEERLHESLGNMTPVEYLESKQPETSILMRY